MSDAAPPRYRPNVGVVLFERGGRAWLGRRAGQAGPHNWQFPQGGVDAGEDLLAAARRELQEETGVTSASLLARAPGFVTYDFPPGYTESRSTRGFAGQRQAWFAFRFDGEEAEVALDRHHQVEFDAWRWATLDEALETVVPFKLQAYREVVAAFGPLAASLAADARAAG